MRRLFLGEGDISRATVVLLRHGCLDKAMRGGGGDKMAEWSTLPQGFSIPYLLIELPVHTVRKFMLAH